MVRTTVIAMVLATVLNVSPVLALQLTNRDPAPHLVTIIENNISRIVSIAPAETLALCSGGCAMRIGDAEEYSFEGNETLSIEENLMFIDEPTPLPTQSQRK